MFYLLKETDFYVGSETWVSANSPSSPFAIVFESDDKTAYLYALDTQAHEQPIIDALHVYNICDITDTNMSSKVQLCWHKNGLVGVLLINDYPHVVYDFRSKVGYSRNNFPEPAIGSEWKHEILTDECIEKIHK